MPNLVGTVITSGEGVWLAADGQVWWNRHIQFVTSCEMNFAKMPFDKQRCKINFEDFIHSSTEVRLTFKDDVPALWSKMHGGTIEWNLVPPITGTGSEGGTLYFLSLSLSLEFERNSGYYQSQIIVPMVVFVFIAWLSFFIQRDGGERLCLEHMLHSWTQTKSTKFCFVDAGTADRPALGIICLLVAQHLVSSVSSELPKVSESVWLLNFLNTSIFFCAYSIAEYTVCNYLRRIQDRCEQEAERLASEQRHASALVLARNQVHKHMSHFHFD